MAALRFLKQIGPDRVYGRIHQLARGVRERLAKLPKIELLTPADDRLYAGMVSFQFKGVDTKPLYELARKRGIWIAGSERLRISTHIHTRPADLDAFFETMHDSLGIG
jgi:selenocysteine lyase/cysteine desulfurase